jgi:ComF family protein
MGTELYESEFYQNIDCIIPVPLHKNREANRGYNQSEWIAKGLGVILNAEVETRNLIRTVATETQTRKTRFERWENVERIFKVQQPERLENKHVLLIDDIITTGSTLEACASILLQIEGVRVSVAALGYTQ